MIRHWRSFYSDLLKHAGELSEFGHSPYFYTSVIDENEKARKALTGNKSDFEYSKVAGYSMVNIFFRWPFAVFQKPSGNHRVRRAKDGDLQDLEKFMEEQQKQKSYGFRYGDGELRRRFDRWPGFSIKSFILAFDEKNKIVGAFAPWATEGIKSNVIEKYPFYMRFIGLFKKIPKFGEPLKVTYLTHMDIDMSLPSKIREQIFSGMLNWYYRQKELPHVHMISFCDYEGSRLQTGIKGFCFQTIPMTLYSVGVPGGCHFESREAGFEMALV